MSKFWSDILKDRNSDKFSGTKFLGFIGGGLLFLLFVESMFLMWKSTQIDYILVGEMIGFVLTLFGYKNIKRKGINPEEIKDQINKMQIKLKENPPEEL